MSDNVTEAIKSAQSSQATGFSALNALKNLKQKQNKCLHVLPDVNFNGMEDNEKVVLLIRANRFFLYLRFLVTIVTAILFYIVMIFLLRTIGDAIDIPLGVYYFELFLITLGVTIFMLITSFISWYYDLFIISTNRILDLDVYGMGSASWTTARLENIEDVEVKNKGLLQMLLKVGDLYLQTAGKEAKIELKNINHPLEVQDIIMDFSQMRRQQAGNNFRNN